MLPKPASCQGCYGWRWGSKGFVPADGSGRNGVLIVMEAAGEHEAQEGLPAVGKAGHYLFSNLARVGLQRDDFRIHNVLSCQPPGNKLSGMSYELEVINTCSPILDATIADMRERCKGNGKHFTILTLGVIAFKRVMGFDAKDPILKKDYHCYPFRNEKYGAWVVAAHHPSFLMRGNNHLIPVLQFAAQRAVELAEKEVEIFIPSKYLLDPSPSTFAQWVKDYLRFIDSNPDAILSYDIETPMKQGKDEEEVSKETDDDYTILRCSFCYKVGESVSVPWRAEYLPYLEEIFASKGTKAGWNSENYDSIRIKAQ